MIKSYSTYGFEGEVISVEVDLRRGIPGVEIIGLPDNTIKESRERIRSAIRRGGFEFPRERVLINLAPAGIRKEGANHDLAIATAILATSNAIEFTLNRQVMIFGELLLTGEVRPVTGVLSGVTTGLQQGIFDFIVPKENCKEAASFEEARLYPVSSIKELPKIISLIIEKKSYKPLPEKKNTPTRQIGDFSEIQGQKILKRAMEIGAAGYHNLLIFGPPGCGKTMSARRFPGILPPLNRENALEVTQIWSQAGKIKKNGTLLNTPPFRMPHHSASMEGLIGGGKKILPGEVALAHKGVMFLDEAPEFGSKVLQSLREPLENGRVSIIRAGQRFWYPADFQLILAANPCPCGNMGKRKGVCLCSKREIDNYWKKIGGALLDRIDIRIPVSPVDPEELLKGPAESSESIKKRVTDAVNIQERRFAKTDFKRNGRIPAGLINEFCPMAPETKKLFTKAVREFSLSSRACHSILKIGRTIADLDQSKTIEENHILEAIYYRRYGDSDIYWDTL